VDFNAGSSISTDALLGAGGTTLEMEYVSTTRREREDRVIRRSGVVGLAIV